MWKNYLKVAIRNTLKNKIYVIINVIGLGIAIAFGLTIFMLYAFNYEFDNYYKDTTNVIRVNELKTDADGTVKRYDLAPIPMGPRLAAEVAGIESQTRFITWWDNVVYEDKVFNQSVGYVDTNFFDFFKIGLRSGSYSSLKEKSRIFLTSEMARKYFGESDPVGKILTIYYPDKRSTDYTVAGVFERIPFNSSFKFDALTQIDNFFIGHQVGRDDWTTWQQASTFLRIADMSMMEELDQQMNTYLEIQNEAREEWKVADFELVGFKDGSIINTQKLNGGYTIWRLSYQVIAVFTSMALLILMIACFNLANTTMALMAYRVREIGIRKVMGGGARHVFSQFMFEMSWTTFLAMLAGLAMFRWIFDGFFSLWGFSFNVLDISGTSLVLGFVGFFLLVTVIAGIYPAVYSRRFQPAVIFRNRIKLKGSSLLSRILNSLQFAFALVVLIAGLTFMQNAEFLETLDLGYQKDHVISIWLDDQSEYQLMRDKIKSNPDIIEFAGTDDQLAGAWSDTYLQVDTGSVEIRSRRVGEGYMDLMGVNLIHGRMFNKDQESDFTEGVIVNQAYVDRFIKGDPIGKLVNLKEGKRYVIGVIGNIIYNVYEGFKYIPEIYIPNREEESNTLVVKAGTSNREEVYDFLVKSWKEVIPYRPFSGSYQEDIAVGDAMETTRNLREIFFYLAILGSLLSMTGIFALSSLNVASRFKEIGIRKVMGATSKGILFHINKDFIIVLVVSILLGTGLGYFLTSTLLSFIYEYHTSVEFVTLVLCGILVGIVAMVTTSLTIMSAANTNPAHILRDE
jgi:ABC-type antimicrobial peptide transport system permease subunit